MNRIVQHNRFLTPDCFIISYSSTPPSLKWLSYLNPLIKHSHKTEPFHLNNPLSIREKSSSEDDLKNHYSSSFSPFIIPYFTRLFTPTFSKKTDKSSHGSAGISEESKEANFQFKKDDCTYFLRWKNEAKPAKKATTSVINSSRDVTPRESDVDFASDTEAADFSPEELI